LTVFTVLVYLKKRYARVRYENNQQDALYRLIYYSKSALHVSGDVFAHHQEHLTVFTVLVYLKKRYARVSYENNQQDALYRLIYYSKSDLHVSGDVFAHHQEHLTVFTVLVYLKKRYARVSYENNQQDALYRLIYYSKSALHVSGDVFAHHQDRLTVFTVSGSVHPSCWRNHHHQNVGSFTVVNIWDSKNVYVYLMCLKHASLTL